MAAVARRERDLYRRAVRAVARESGLGAQAIVNPRGGAARRARQIATYVACVAGGVPLRPLSRVVGVNLYAIQHALARIEDARDDAQFDAFISRLEGEITDAAHA